MKRCSVWLFMGLIFACLIHAQSLSNFAMEGGKGFIYTKSAETCNQGFLGLSAYGIFSSINLSSSQEKLFSSVAAFTYATSNRMELAMILYAVGRGVIADEIISDSRIETGLGESQFALKYRMPFIIGKGRMGGPCGSSCAHGH